MNTPNSIRSDGPVGLHLGWLVLMATLCSASLGSVSTPMAGAASVADLVCALVSGHEQSAATPILASRIRSWSGRLATSPVPERVIEDRRCLVPVRESDLPPPSLG